MWGFMFEFFLSKTTSGLIQMCWLKIPVENQGVGGGSDKIYGFCFVRQGCGTTKGLK